MAEGGYDPMISEQNFENRVYEDEDEYDTEAYTRLGEEPDEKPYDPDDP